MRFVEEHEFSCSPDEIWGRVSDLDSIPVYWHGTKEIRISKEGEKVRAEVVFAFGGRGTAEVTVDPTKRTLTIMYLDGPFDGTQRVSVGEKTITAEWDVSFRGAFRLLGPANASHFQSGTRNALKRLSNPEALS
jgi:hypothetical protein